MLASERAEKARATPPKESIYFFHGYQKMKLLILSLASALLVLSNPEANASVLLDWASVPEPDRMLEPTVKPPGPNGTYTTGADFSNVLVKVAGSNFAPAGLHNPKIDEQGHPYSVPVLSSAANFKASGTGTPTVTFTIDFFGFKQGVRDVSFELFNVDAVKRGNTLVPDVVTFQTAGLSLTSGKDNVVSGNTVTGTGISGSESTDEPGGDVAVHSGNLPLHQIVFTWTQLANPEEFLDEIAIGNISFTPVPEVGQLVIGFVACLLGAFWLHKNRRKRAHSIS
jgi:hypothetical protein